MRHKVHPSKAVAKVWQGKVKQVVFKRIGSLFVIVEYEEVLVRFEK